MAYFKKLFLKWIMQLRIYKKKTSKKQYIKQKMHSLYPKKPENTKRREGPLKEMEAILIKRQAMPLGNNVRRIQNRERPTEVFR